MLLAGSTPTSVATGASVPTALKLHGWQMSSAPTADMVFEGLSSMADNLPNLVACFGGKAVSTCFSIEVDEEEDEEAAEDEAAADSG